MITITDSAVINGKKHCEFWRVGAAEDWEVAEKLVSDGKVRHGLFFAHLALEKTLKGLISLHTNALAPRVHNLNQLAETAGLRPNEEQKDLLAEMNQFSVEGRYPSMRLAAPSAAEAEDYVRRAREVLSWLTRQF
jgi:HEPN domain-containing protein